MFRRACSVSHAEREACGPGVSLGPEQALAWQVDPQWLLLHGDRPALLALAQDKRTAVSCGHTSGFWDTASWWTWAHVCASRSTH